MAETDAMVTATTAVASASNTLIAQLNDAERQVSIPIARAKTGANAFVVENAALYSTLGIDAPQTQRFDVAITLLKTYAALIKSLVEGQSATDEANAIKTTVDNLSAIGKIAPQFTAEFTALDAAFDAFVPIAQKALLIQTRAEARVLVEQGREPVTTLIAALKNATPAMFHLLITAGYSAAPTAAAPDRDKLRVLLSNYVVLLDQLQVTFDKLADAFAHHRQPVFRFRVLRLQCRSRHVQGLIAAALCE